MSDLMCKIGSVVKRYEDTEVEWKITDFFSLAESNRQILGPIFSFAETVWSFQLFPKSKSQSRSRFMKLYVAKGRADISVEYTFSLKTLSGGDEFLNKGIIMKESRSSAPCFLKLSEIQQRQSEIAPSNVLTIVATLKRIADQSDKSRVLELPKNKKVKHLDTLSMNFKSLFTNKYSCDTTLHVRDKEYIAHKAVLMARSSVFTAMFLHDTIEKQTGIVNIPDCEPVSFEKFLQYVYCGKIDDLSPSDAVHLYETSNKYDVEELKISCMVCLAENLTVENVCDIAIFADKYGETNLLSEVQEFFNRYANEIVDTSKWDSLVENNNGLSKTLLKEALSRVKLSCSVST